MKKTIPHRVIASTSVVLLSLFPSVSAQEHELSDGDRMVLMDKLKEIENASNERVSGLYMRAINAYRAAVSSDEETMKLYLNCYEKLNYTDKNRKPADFREWKKKNDDKLDSASFRMALRMQLAWLLLSIETASKDGDVTEMAGRALAHLNKIFENAGILKDHNQVLKQNAVGSVFAKAYELNIKIKDWPSSALDIENIFEKLIMPPLRNLDQVGELRAAWGKKILYLGKSIEVWSEDKSSDGSSTGGSSTGGGSQLNGSRLGASGGSSKAIKENTRSSKMETFLRETRPNLIWSMEKDCFELGDEKTAAVNMLKHLETYVKHKDAPKWIDEFHGLIAPPEVIIQDLEE